MRLFAKLAPLAVLLASAPAAHAVSMGSGMALADVRGRAVIFRPTGSGGHTYHDSLTGQRLLPTGNGHYSPAPNQNGTSVAQHTQQAAPAQLGTFDALKGLRVPPTQQIHLDGLKQQGYAVQGTAYTAISGQPTSHTVTLKNAAGQTATVSWTE